MLKGEDAIGSSARSEKDVVAHEERPTLVQRGHCRESLGWLR